MVQLISRRHFMQVSAASVAVISTTGGVATASQPIATQPVAQPKKIKPPPIEPDLVREFVGAGHAKLDRCKEMLAQYPGIINSTWDWGGGDWETALGGASHMGRPDIALFLLHRGARMDLFAAAMLGKLDIIRAACEAFPHTPQVPGPHGITLIEHARKGGETARAVLDYLQSLG